MYYIRVFCSIFCSLYLAIPTLLFAESADEVYSQFADSIFQIRIIEVKSGSQSALGSGFVIDNGRYIATNYHVVSSKVLKPEKYRVEVEVGGEKTEFHIAHVDVVGDLALLRSESFNATGRSFELRLDAPNKGAKVYSLGNPHDIGMTVVEGNYNGFVDNSFLPQIHFSGAINSGMSGGPAVDESSRVVGINVASAGNQIGFLVPVAKLITLLEDVHKKKNEDINLLDEMGVQIERTTSAMVDEILQAKWPMSEIGKARAVDQMVGWIECWGNSNKNKETRLQGISRGCNNGSSIYVDSDLRTGFFEYEFYYAEVEQWPAASFYRHLMRDTSNAVPGNRASKHHVKNFTCVDEQVKLVGGMRQKISYCSRPYINFPDLFDVFYIAVSNDKKNQAVMSHYTFSGINKKSANQFLERFMSALTWE